MALIEGTKIQNEKNSEDRISELLQRYCPLEGTEIRHHI